LEKHASGAMLSSAMEGWTEGQGARAVIGADGSVWNANDEFCSLVGIAEPALQRLGWRRLVHASDRRYMAAHLVEVLAGSSRREFDVRLVPPDGSELPARLSIELVRDASGRQGWFLMEARTTT
jgi:PAS domain S-box-containing protein